MLLSSMFHVIDIAKSEEISNFGDLLIPRIIFVIWPNNQPKGGPLQNYPLFIQ